MIQLLSLCLLLSLSAHAADSPSIAPVRPTYQDMSLKVINDTYHQYPYMWFRGHTATQTEKDAMQETLFGMGLPEAIRYARSIPACVSAANKAIGMLNNVSSKLGPVYEGNSLLPNGSWLISLNGRHYSFERYALEAIQSCSITGTGSTQCAASPLLTQNLADFLDIKKVGTHCVKGSDVVVPVPTEPYDSQRGQADLIMNKVRRPALTETQIVALHATHAAHVKVSDWRCGSGSAPLPGAVDNEHQAFERTARTLSEQHFFSMKRFTGAVDPLWTKSEECQWARLQDAAHERWMNQVIAGNWGLSREAENDHQLAHVCMNLKSPLYKVVFSCGDPSGPASCPKLTCQEMLTISR